MPSNSDLMEKKGDVLQHIADDILYFQKLIDIIDSLQSTDFLTDFEKLSSLKETSLKIHRNGKDQGKEHYLRNKYGKIDYATDKRREWGIDFELIANIGSITKGNLIKYAQYYNLVKKYLQNIKSQLEAAIKVEQGELEYKDAELIFIKIYIDKSIGEDLFKLQKLLYATVGREYLNAIHEELVSYDKHKIDLSRREDRYYYARVITKIGELLRQLESVIGVDEGIFRVFKIIRNTVAHDINFMSNDLSVTHKRIYEFFSGELYSHLSNHINNMISQLKEHDLCQKEGDKLNDITLYITKLSQEQSQAFNKLRKIVFEGEGDFDDKLFTTFSREVKSILFSPAHEKVKLASSSEDQKAFTAFGAIESLIKFSRKCKSAKESQKIIIPEEEKINNQWLVEALNANMPQELKDQHLPVPPSKEQLQTLKKNLKGKDFTFSAKYKSSKSIKEIQVSDLLSNNNPKMPDVQQTPKENEEVIQKSKITKFEEKCKLIEEEIKFITTLLKKKDIDEVILRYAIEFSIAKIGQIHRDIRQFKLDMHLKFDMPAQYQGAAKRASQKRNEIMHNSLKKSEDLIDILYRHILPAGDQIKALNSILSMNEKIDSGFVDHEDSNHLLALAIAYKNIDNFEKAFSFLQFILTLKNIQIIDNDLGKSVIQYLQRADNKHSYLSMHNYLYFSAIILGNYGDYLLKSNEIEKAKIYYTQKIQIIELIRKKFLNDPRKQASLYGSIAGAHLKMEQFEKALSFDIEAFKAFVKSEDKDLKSKALYISNLAQSYYRARCLIESKKSESNYETDNMRYHNALSLAALYYARKIHILSKKDKNEIYVYTTAAIAKLAFQNGNVILAQNLLKESISISKSMSMYKDHYVLRIINDAIDLQQMAAPENRDPYFKYKNDLETYQLLIEFRQMNSLGRFFDNNEISWDLKGEFDDANNKLKEKTLIDSDRKQVEFSYNNFIGCYHLRRGAYKEALWQYLMLACSGQPHYLQAIIYENIGDAYLGLKNYNKAIENFVLSINSHAQELSEERAFYIPQKIVECFSKEASYKDIDAALQKSGKLGGNYKGLSQSLQESRDLMAAKLSESDKHYLEQLDQLIALVPKIRAIEYTHAMAVQETRSNTDHKTGRRR